MKEKTAVVLSGGGSKGAYEIGVWKALNQMQIDYDIVTGTSVGALNGSLMVSGDYDNAAELWSKISTNMILNCDLQIDMSTPESQKHSIASLVNEVVLQGSIDQTPLKQLLTEALDPARFFASPLAFGCAAVEFPSLKPKLFYKNDLDEENLIDCLMASSACFPAMRPHTFCGSTYIDGGYHDNLPLNMAIELGARRIIAVDLKAIGICRPCNDPSVEIITVSPIENLGFMLLFDAKIARHQISLGCLDTLKAFGKLDGIKYAFPKDSFLLLQKQMDALQYRLKRLLQKNTEQSHSFLYRQMAHLTLLKSGISPAPQPDKPLSVITCAEAAAVILELAPDEEYHMTEFNSKLKLAWIAAQRDAQLRKMDPADPFNGLTDTKIITVRLYWQMETIFSQGQVHASFLAASSLFPLQLNAAAYLYLIHHTM